MTRADAQAGVPRERAARETLRDDALLAAGYTDTSMTARCLSLLKGPFGAGWWIALAMSAMLTGLMLVSIVWLLVRGVGVWGVDNTTGWGFAITNFVWWIGIGHAGTLISAILLLMRQRWRNSVNRFAEAMTLFAVAMAGIFPLLHLGRPGVFYWLLPYPNQLDMWPQWRSPLVWDVIAVLTYGTVSLLFWYMGLLPDLATLRAFARRKTVRRIAGIFSLGWCGSARQWRRHHAVYFLLAAVATPLVVSVHSIVSLDFAVAIVPGWHATIFPPYFVAGAIFSGMAMVLTITIPLRRALSLHDLITPRHLDAMAKVTLASALVVTFGYLMESFSEWLSGDVFELTRLRHRFVEPGAGLFLTVLACNALAPQALWWRSVRRSPVWLFALSIVINIGMWLERYDIVISSLSHSSHLPSSRGPFDGTFWDWSLLIGSFGAFTLLFLLFVRFIPIVSIHDMRELLHETEDDAPSGRQERSNTKPGAHAATAVDRGPSVAVSADALLARFSDEERLLNAAKSAREHGLACDAFTPNRSERVEEALGLAPTRLPWVMAIAAVAGGAGAYFLQCYSATAAYPWNVGGRPLHSWPSFLPLTFEVGVLAGSLAGFIGFCIANRMPRPFHPAWLVHTFARAQADRYFLLVDAGSEQERAERIALLRGLGAERVSAVGGS